MAYNARVYRILVASPSDVEEEREQISKVIQEWNDLYSFERKIVLLPLKWETHSSPEYGTKPQDVINKEVVDYCDLAIGVFWTRLGSPTGQQESGTVEEIERVGKSGKIVMLYFSKAKVELDDIDLDQYKKLKDFKKKTYPNSLIVTYKNIVDFRDKFAKQLEIKLRSLITDDSDVTEDNLSSNSIAGIEIALRDPRSNEIINENSRLTTTVSAPANLDKVPKYKKQDKDDYKDEDYYLKIIENYIKKSRKIDLNVSLKNIGRIGIRDIYIELRIYKNEAIKLNSNHEELLGKIYRKFWTNSLLSEYQDIVDNKESIAEEFEDHYLIIFKLPALQPQRTINLDEKLSLFILDSGTVEMEAQIYADCFPKPVIEKLKYKVGYKTIEFDALEYLEKIEVD